MRDYGKVFSRIWESADFRSLTEDGRTLVLYLLTCQHGTLAGVFRVPDGYACEDLQWTAERVRQGFAELFRKGFANRCETTKWVWVTNYLTWNPPENPNQRKAAAKIVAGVPDSCCWVEEFEETCGPLLRNEKQKDEIKPRRKPSAKGSTTVPQPVTGTGAGEGDNPPLPPEGGEGGGDEDERARELAAATQYGLVCRALLQAGVHDAAPHHPTFRAMVDAGVTAEEFTAFADKAKGKAAPFAYLLTVVETERKQAARVAAEIPRGPTPSRQDAAPPRPHLDAKATQELLREQKLTPEQIEANRARAAEIRRSRLGQGTGAQPEAEGATA